MVAPISDQRARAFAEALITHAGKQTAAARACGYPDDPSISQRAKELARNPKVLRILQPLAAAHLASLTPQAIQTLAALLTNKSGYIRLEAAKDILNRNGVGSAPEQIRQPPLVIRINLGDAMITDHVPQSQIINDIKDIADYQSAVSVPSPHEPLEGDPPLNTDAQEPRQEASGSLGVCPQPDLSLDEPTTVYASLYADKPGGPKPGVPKFATTLPQDFPQKGAPPTHDFSSESVFDEGVSGFGRLEGGVSEVVSRGEDEAGE